jgi:hypothetical protein
MLAIQRFTAIGAIDAAFWLYRQHFGLLFAINLSVGVPVTLFGALHAYWQTQSAEPAGGFLAGSLSELAVSLLAGAFATAAITQAASQIALGKAASVGHALNSAWRVFARLIATSLLAGACVGMIALLGGMVLAAVSLGLLTPAGPQRYIMGAAILVGVLVPLLLLFVRWSLVAPIVVLEGARPARALGRSAELSEGRRGKIIAVIGLYLLASVAIAAGMAALGGMLGETELAREILRTAATQATSALLSPILNVAIALLYYDARVEHEAFDVATLAALHTPLSALPGRA